MAAIEKTFYGNANANAIKAKEVSGNSEVDILTTAGLLWGWSTNGTGTGYLFNDDADDVETNIGHIGTSNMVFQKPVAFSDALRCKMSNASSKVVVYYE